MGMMGTMEGGRLREIKDALWTMKHFTGRDETVLHDR